MMSLLALSGFVAYGLGGLTDDFSDADDAPEDFADETFLGDAGLVHASGDLVHPDPEGEPSEIFEFARGDLITGFDPDHDVLELEYTASLGQPDITVTDFQDGTGASVALNGVVVADIVGAQGLDPADIVLTPL
jgi:hypothetical protein